jgi:hypothetical protein
MIIELNELRGSADVILQTKNILINTDKIIIVEHYNYVVKGAGIKMLGAKVKLTAAMVHTVIVKESVEDIKKLIFGTKL